MKKTLLGGLTLVVALGLGAYAAEDHSTPGTPGAPNCEGQTTAYLAQASKNGQEEIPPGFRGLGGITKVTGLSVQEIHAIVAAYCAQ